MGRRCPAPHSHSKSLAPQCSALPSVPSPPLRALPLSSAEVGDAHRAQGPGAKPAACAPISSAHSPEGREVGKLVRPYSGGRERHRSAPSPGPWSCRRPAPG